MDRSVNHAGSGNRQGDCIHRLNEHPLFKPIGPNQLDEAWGGQAMLQDPVAIGQDLFDLFVIEGDQIG